MSKINFNFGPQREVPSIPAIGNDLTNHTAVLNAIVEILQITNRQNPQDTRHSFVRLDDLNDLGIVDLTDGALPKTPGNTLPQYAVLGGVKGGQTLAGGTGGVHGGVGNTTEHLILKSTSNPSVAYPPMIDLDTSLGVLLKELQTVAGTTVSNTPKKVKVLMAGTPYYWLIYPS